MTSPDSSYINILFGIALLMSVMYASGRLHQWFRQAQDRDQAFRDGYNQATESLFTVATRAATAVKPVAATATVTAISNAPSARGARHSAEDRPNLTTERLPYARWSA